MEPSPTEDPATVEQLTAVVTTMCGELLAARSEITSLREELAPLIKLVGQAMQIPKIAKALNKS